MAILINSKTAQDEKDRWGTRWDCFYDAMALTGYRFILDVCAEEQTAKCGRFISPSENALSVDWVERAHWLQTMFTRNTPSIGGAVYSPAAWCNPPFTQKEAFLSRAFDCARRGLPVVCLTPYDRSTNWWRDHVRGKATRVFIPDGRYNFLKVDGKTKKTGVNFLSCFIEYGVGAGAMETQYIDFVRGVYRRVAA
ncbi:phage N-6-adenine-methyltransferase [Aestuariibacter halophilus]|uniref:Phage N-6-adenine-methyltransferase n=1 Tax=Fluctibacter halophilus TaxID=226011 RepID=A0ABS8G829_9ALTE|nr:phage N-6-adenine-methyltransferase [Aestuariibacter halophilus]MCC2615975.1 phage N-6-adenine-methyltransferase [Aestuariibacter halophilus]